MKISMVFEELSRQLFLSQTLNMGHTKILIRATQICIGGTKMIYTENINLGAVLTYYYMQYS